MALRSRNKVNPNFSMASMTDLVFLLLVFFMVTSTLVHPTALKLLLPESNSQTKAKPLTSVSITSDLNFYIEDEMINIDDMERKLVEKLGKDEDVYIALHADKSVDIEYVVKVMNIAKRNNFKMILATNPEK